MKTELLRPTDGLIDDLVADAGPVRRLPPPSVRGLAWLAASVAAGFLLILAAGLEGTIAAALDRWSTVAQLAATMLTALMAILAAFHLSVPGRDPRWLLLLAVPVSLWVSSISWACVEDWLIMGWEALRVVVSTECIALMFSISLPLTALAVFLLRRAAPLDGPLSGALAALAAAAVTSAIVQILYPLERGVLVLLWNFGSVVVIAGMGWLFGHLMFRVVAPRSH